MSTKTDFKLIKTLFVALAFMFCSAALHAQTFVPKAIALERLELKLEDVHKQTEQGFITPMQKQIASMYIDYIVFFFR